MREDDDYFLVRSKHFPKTGLSPPQRPIAFAAFAFAVINYFVAALMQDEKDTRNADEMALRRRKSILT